MTGVVIVGESSFNVGLGLTVPADDSSVPDDVTVDDISDGMVPID